MRRNPKKEMLACSSGKGDREERCEYENVRRGGGEEEKGKERESGRRGSSCCSKHSVLGQLISMDAE